MRARDLRAHVEYATCNGHLVVPIPPVHANWYYSYNHDTDQWDLIDGGDEPKVNQDPWGPCHKPANRGLPVNTRRTKPGVLVDVFDHDREGNRVEPAYDRIIIPPGDIAGTWKEYLALYADVVAARVDERQREQDREVAIEEIKRNVAQRCKVDPEQVDLEQGRRAKEEGFITARVRIELSTPYPLDDSEDPYIVIADRLPKGE